MQAQLIILMDSSDWSIPTRKRADNDLERWSSISMHYIMKNVTVYLYYLEVKAHQKPPVTFLKHFVRFSISLNFNCLNWLMIRLEIAVLMYPSPSLCISCFHLRALRRKNTNNRNSELPDELLHDAFIRIQTVSCSPRLKKIHSIVHAGVPTLTNIEYSK